MINDYYLITIHTHDPELMHNWTAIEDFIKDKGWDCIDEYLEIETNFISTIKMFNDYFSNNEYFNSLVAKIDVYEEYDCIFYGLDGDYKKLQEVAKKDFDSLTDSDKDFIYRCQCRRMCSFWFIDVTTMSYLHSAMDPFFLHVHLHANLQINKIFKPTNKVYYCYDQNHYDVRAEVVPENCGENIRLE